MSEREAVMIDVTDPSARAAITDQALELMRSGCPEQAAFYWGAMIVGLRSRAATDWQAHGLAAMDELRRLYFEGSEGDPGHILVKDWEPCEAAIRAALSEGAAPRHGGAAFDRLIAVASDMYAVWPTTDSEIADAIQKAIDATEGAAPRAEGLEREALERIARLLEGDRCYEALEVAVTTLARLRPSDERVPESEEENNP